MWFLGYLKVECEAEHRRRTSSYLLRLGLKLSILRYSLAGSDDPKSSLSCSVIDIDAGDFQKCSVSSSLILAHSLCAYTPFCILSLVITITKKRYHDKACNTHASPDNVVNVVGFYFNHLYLFILVF